MPQTLSAASATTPQPGTASNARPATPSAERPTESVVGLAVPACFIRSILVEPLFGPPLPLAPRLAVARREWAAWQSNDRSSAGSRPEAQNRASAVSGRQRPLHTVAGRPKLRGPPCQQRPAAPPPP